MNESPAKIKYFGEFSQLKIHSLALQREKRTHSNWRWNVLVCLSEYTVTDHGSILAVNKYYASTNLVKFIFKSFVSCNLHSGLLRSKQHGLQIFIQGSKKPPSSRPGQVDFPFGQVTFSPSLPNGQGPRQAVRRLNFWQRFWEEKVSSTLKGNQVFRQSKWRKLQFIVMICWLRDGLSRLRSGCLARD